MKNEDVEKNKILQEFVLNDGHALWSFSQEITVKFEYAGEDKTKLSIIYEGVTGKQYDAMMKSGMNEGWNTSLDKLAESLK